MNTLGERLTSERRRLKLTQVQLATIGGVGKNMQYKYEKDKVAPDSQYLINLYNHGVDVSYILFAHQESSPPAPIVDALQKDVIGIPIYQPSDKDQERTTEQNHSVYLPKSLFNEHNIPLQDTVLTRISSDVMQPFIKNNDWILINTHDKNLANGGTFFYRLGPYELVSNLQYQGKHIMVSGTNPSFQPYMIDLSDETIDFDVIGRVVISIHHW